MSFSDEVVSDIKAVLDITSRVDERVKFVQENQIETHDRLNQLSKEITTLMSRVSVLESENGSKAYKEIQELELKVEKSDIAKLPDFIDQVNNKLSFLDHRIASLEDAKNGMAEKVKRYFGLVVQGAWVIIVCYLLYKLGLSAPLTP
jgi:chromosome segregation ATPase